MVQCRGESGFGLAAVLAPAFDEDVSATVSVLSGARASSE